MAEHRLRVKETLGPLVAVANPLDYNTFIWNNEPALMATFSAFVSSGFDLNMLVLDFPRGDRCGDADWWPTVEAFSAALAANGAKGAIVASMPENLPEEYCAGLLARGIVPLMGIAEALDAADAAVAVGEGWRRPPSLSIGIVTPPSGLPEGGASHQPDEAAAKKVCQSLTGIYVRKFTFDADYAYPKADIDGIRRQLAAPGWSRIVEARSRKEQTDVDVYLLVDGGKARGLAVIASEPREFAIVNIVGSIDLEKLHDLEGQFGVPELQIEPARKPAPVPAPAPKEASKPRAQ